MSGVRLLGWTALAMLAFAANSVLNRMAVGAGAMDPLAFAAVRVVAGAVMLALLVGLRGGAVWAGWRGRLPGVFGLVVYLVGFSVAYLALGAGVGALILFGAVQVTMFAGAVLSREVVPGRRWLGAGLAFAGLVGLVAPGGAEVPVAGAVAMACAGFGWGIYSLAGRGATDALGATAWNFVLSVPVVIAVALLVGQMQMSVAGLWLAVLSGAVTSGLGYALWYRVVPELGAARAGVAQLTVPMLAALGGALVMGEAVGWRFWAASALILGGVALASRQSALSKR
ncbi:MAG: DMT family transporter [Pseudotabrizicola sp.]|uniref:DMT family transporter n=1 Tax=Pseudotabrizicola sp. TaxID=2939647 RepID=UPI0027176B57|nr:DMT family transporter [Pseudotabrizicola sp.]MDO8885130.1 DMT family transporter [Pseudotabrizicola sp.]MDP2080756.1 DMT family transporter [Pseudotabrizicola sp.]MDZ7574658.1 DMT family transporter [Pseudotabrizicola sp.]